MCVCVCVCVSELPLNECAILEFVIKARKTVKSLKVIYNNVFMGNGILTHDPSVSFSTSNNLQLITDP